MRSRDKALHHDVVARRLALLRTELARDWQQAGDLPELAADPSEAGVSATEASGAPPGRAAVESAIESAIENRAGGVPPRQSSGARAVAALLPESLRGRLAFEPWQLAVVALLVAVGLVATCWHVVRSGASATAAPAPTPSATVAAASSTSPSPLVALSSGSSASAAGSLGVVDVEGAVRRPGVKRLPAGSRVLDALQAAGGARRRSRLDGLNLAAVLSDGEQIRVGVPGGGLTSDAGAAGAADGAGATVDLNTADETQLDSLPGVGPVTAQAILQWRQRNGRFTSVDELLEISGIGPKTLAQIAPHATV